MDNRYQQFCIADNVFYDTPDTPNPNANKFEVRYDSSSTDWNVEESSGWKYFSIPNFVMPNQGWKIHISATPENAQTILSIVSDYCFKEHIPFKHLPSMEMLLLKNMKYADRSGSGKFITIYPSTDSASFKVADELDKLLNPLEGPYILSDVRWNSGPVFIRYGAFKPRYCKNNQGVLVPAIESPNGDLEPDRREPQFTPPTWLDIPLSVKYQIDKLGSSEPPKDFKYEILHPIHFSNGGGVYEAESKKTNAKVILKEARPFSGLDPSGLDAVTRLNNESHFLDVFAEQAFAVDKIEDFKLFEHHFLAEAYVSGETLNKTMVKRYPLIHAYYDKSSVNEYTKWAINILQQVDQSLKIMHAQNVVFGDVHPNNIMIDDKGGVVFIDFEMAHQADDLNFIALGAPGYVPSDKRKGIARDKYAFGCLQLAMFCPLNPILNLQESKIFQYLDFIESEFPVDKSYRISVLENLGIEHKHAITSLDAQKEVYEWGHNKINFKKIINLQADALNSHATIHRKDRLYPGDIEQFNGTALGIAYGAAGVMLALEEINSPIPDEQVNWFVSACESKTVFRNSVGLFDGAAGAAINLYRLGNHELALNLISNIQKVDLSTLPSHLYGGLAGIGLSHLIFGELTGKDDNIDFASACASELAHRFEKSDHTQPFVSSNARRAGLLWGTSGQALLFIHLYKRTLDTKLLETAERMIKNDLLACVSMPEDNSLQVNEGWRVLPYLATGSTGIGLSILQYLKMDPDSSLQKELYSIHKAAEPRFIIGAGLFNGRAGLIHYLMAEHQLNIHPENTDQLIKQHISDLSWHAIGDKNGISTVGDQLLRLSDDYATGTSGIMLTLHRAAKSDYSFCDNMPLINLKL